MYKIIGTSHSKKCSDMIPRNLDLESSLQCILGIPKITSYEEFDSLDFGLQEQFLVAINNLPKAELNDFTSYRSYPLFKRHELNGFEVMVRKEWSTQMRHIVLKHPSGVGVYLGSFMSPHNTDDYKVEIGNLINLAQNSREVSFLGISQRLTKALVTLEQRPVIELSSVVSRSQSQERATLQEVQAWMDNYLNKLPLSPSGLQKTIDQWVELNSVPGEKSQILQQKYLNCLCGKLNESKFRAGISYLQGQAVLVIASGSNPLQTLSLQTRSFSITKSLCDALQSAKALKLEICQTFRWLSGMDPQLWEDPQLSDQPYYQQTLAGMLGALEMCSPSKTVLQSFLDSDRYQPHRLTQGLRCSFNDYLFSQEVSIVALPLPKITLLLKDIATADAAEKVVSMLSEDQASLALENLSTRFLKQWVCTFANKLDSDAALLKQLKNRLKAISELSAHDHHRIQQDLKTTLTHSVYQMLFPDSQVTVQSSDVEDKSVKTKSSLYPLEHSLKDQFSNLVQQLSGGKKLNGLIKLLKSNEGQVYLAKRFAEIVQVIRETKKENREHILGSVLTICTSYNVDIQKQAVRFGFSPTNLLAEHLKTISDCYKEKNSSVESVSCFVDDAVFFLNLGADFTLRTAHPEGTGNILDFMHITLICCFRAKINFQVIDAMCLRFAKAYQDKGGSLDLRGLIRGKTLLHEAAKHGLLSSTQFLLDQGVNPNTIDLSNSVEGYTPLDECDDSLHKGGPEKVFGVIRKMLIRCGAKSYSFRKNKETIATIEHCGVPVVLFDLIRRAASFTSSANEFNEPLRLSIELSLPRLSESRGNSVWWPIEMALSAYAPDCPQIMNIDLGGLPRKATCLLIGIGSYKKGVEFVDFSALHHAAGKGQRYIYSFLKTSDPRYCIDSEGRTPLHYAVLGACEASLNQQLNYQVIITEMSLNQDINEPVVSLQKQSRFAFQQVEPTDDISVVYDALPLFFQRNKMGAEEGDTVLHLAAKFAKDPQLLKFLVSLGADLEARNSRGLRPCEVCVDPQLKAEFEEIVEEPGKQKRYKVLEYEVDTTPKHFKEFMSNYAKKLVSEERESESDDVYFSAESDLEESDLDA